MELTSGTIGQTSIDDFVEMIPAIYQEHDVKRDIPDVWFHTQHHAAAVGEEVRKGRARGLLEEIADFAMWFFTLLGKLHGELGQPRNGESPRHSLIRIGSGYSQLLWNKYPGMCPVCYWRRTGGRREREERELNSPCDCLLHEVESRDQSQKRAHAEALRAYASERNEFRPVAVDDWEAMFGTIFEANLRHLDMPAIAFHLLEELGEVSDAMVRMYTFKSDRLAAGEVRWCQVWLEEELADVSSWMFALVKKANSIIELANEYDTWRAQDTAAPARPGIKLSTILWRKYGSDDLKTLYCPYGPGQAEKCTCVIAFVPENIEIDRVIQNYQESLPVTRQAEPRS